MFERFSQVARRLGVHRDTVYAWAKSGVTVNGRPVRLAYTRLGRLHVTTAEWLDEFQAACRGEAPPARAARAGSGYERAMESLRKRGVAV